MERDQRDGANIIALEGVLIALILLGAAYAMRPLQDPSVNDLRPRAQLAQLSSDVLIVLGGLNDGNGTSLLDLYLAEALHCAFDAVPSATACQGARSKNMSFKIENYLPLGAGYALKIGNGVGMREVYRSPAPRGESVSASVGFAPEWNLTFLATEFSCYDSGVDINVTMVPVDRGASGWTRWGNATAGSTEAAGERSVWPRGWNATLAGATRPASGTILANVTANASLNGSTTYGTCPLGASFTNLRTALRATPFWAGAAVVPMGGSLDLFADLSIIAAVPGVTILNANVSIIEPLPARAGSPDTWIEAGRIPLTSGSPWSGAWTPVAETLYGTHPVLLRVGVTVGATSVELHRVLTVDVALATGHVPIDAPYRAVLQAWLPDWG